MRLPWEQLAMEVIEVSAPELGDKLYPDLEPELGEAAAGWGIVHLVKWALARCPEHAPPSASALVPGPTAARQVARAARWKGDPASYVAALAALPNPVVELVPEGIRVRGLDRYDAVWGDRNPVEWKAYKAAHPDRFPPGIRRKSAGGPTDSRPSDPDPDTDAEKDSPPPPREPPKLVVVGKKKPLTVEQLTPGQRRWWELMQEHRADVRRLRETAVPPDFPAWADRCDVRSLELRQVGHAHVLYLRDEHFRDRDWPTAVFITPGVFEMRLPKPPEVAHEA